MAIVNAKQITIKAARGGYAVGAFNVTNILQLESAMEAAEEMRAPVIIQTSVTPARFLKPGVIVSVYQTLAKETDIPVCLHLDHCTEVDFCIECADAGYTSIMIDASMQPLEENIRRTREVCTYVHNASNVSVEGELGTVCGVEDQADVAEDDTALADPETAAIFVEKTGIDIFAPAIGTAHGVYKTADPKVDFHRFEKIQKNLNGDAVRVPLVVHGGTGLPVETVKRLVSLGCAKFNVSTALKHVMLDSTFEYIAAHREEYNPGRVDSAVKTATKRLIIEWMDLLGSTGKADEH